MGLTQLAWIDYAIMALYIVFVLGIGFALKRRMRSSTDFFLSGRSIPAWVAGLAFVSANLGAQEVIGMGASGAKYGIATSHFYWVGAIPAMVFVGLFMMPFYYGSKARSVPEYLKLRFDEKTRGFNAITFAAMTVFSSGISLYAMGILLQPLLGWDFNACIWLSAAIVLCYIFFGGLTSAIYNEVVQFFLIVFGFAPLAILGLKDVNGWSGLKEKLAEVATASHLPEGAYTSSWAHMNDPSANPMGIEWFGLAMGLGFVLSFGYWCTDFLVVQRAMAANSMSAARRTPLIGAVPKMFIPFIVILPGMIALVAAPQLAAPASAPAAAQAAVVAADDPAPAFLEHLDKGKGLIPPKIDPKTKEPEVDKDGKIVLDYDKAMPMMLFNYLPNGLLGLGLVALLASFMSGMAGNVTAFNTVWTYDIYQSYIRKDGSDAHYLWMGRLTTVWGIALSVATAYLATQFNNIMDMLQLVFGFVNAPLFATFLLGMFWRRSTGHGAFLGLLAGTLAAFFHHGLTLSKGAAVGIKGGYIAEVVLGEMVHVYNCEMAQNFWAAIWAFCACFTVTVVVSIVTRPRPAEELKGLVYSLTPKPEDHERTWYRKPAAFGVFVMAVAVVLNIIFF